MNVSAIILAGGQSSRMGSDKGLMLFNGKPMIQHCIDTLKAMNLSILIISNSKEYEKFGVPIFSDLIKDKGPLAGIYTGLFHSDEDKNIVVSCDTPLVTEQIFKLLIDKSESQSVTISKFNGLEHPLIGVYEKKGMDVYKEMLDANKLKIRIAISKLNVKVVEMDGISGITALNFKNVNTLDELNTIE